MFETPPPPLLVKGTMRRGKCENAESWKMLFSHLLFIGHPTRSGFSLSRALIEQQQTVEKHVRREKLGWVGARGREMVESVCERGCENVCNFRTIIALKFFSLLI